MPDEDQDAELSHASAWDVATRYHEFRARPSMKNRALLKKLRRLSAQAILERAREVLGSVTHPSEQRILPWSELPDDAEQPDLDLEETVEQSPFALISSMPLAAEDIWMDYSVHRKQPVILSVDTSLSMTGESSRSPRSHWPWSCFSSPTIPWASWLSRTKPR